MRESLPIGLERRLHLGKPLRRRFRIHQNLHAEPEILGTDRTKTCPSYPRGKAVPNDLPLSCWTVPPHPLTPSPLGATLPPIVRKRRGDAGLRREGAAPPP